MTLYDKRETKAEDLGAVRATSGWIAKLGVLIAVALAIGLFYGTLHDRFGSAPGTPALTQMAP